MICCVIAYSVSLWLWFIYINGYEAKPKMIMPPYQYKYLSSRYEVSLVDMYSSEFFDAFIKFIHNFFRKIGLFHTFINTIDQNRDIVTTIINFNL